MFRISIYIIISFISLLIIIKNIPFEININLTTKILILTPLLIGIFFLIKKQKINRLKVNKNNKINFFTYLFVWLLSIIFSYLLFNFFNEPLYGDYLIDSLIYSPLIILSFYLWIVFFSPPPKTNNDHYLNWFKEFRFNKKYWEKYKIFYLSNLVKILFIPYIYGGLNHAIFQILTSENIFETPWSLIQFLFYFGVCCDVIIALGGYVFSSKILGTETVSVDETWQGWLVCLICYPPLLSIYRFFSEQTDNYIWTNWLQPNDFLYWVWAFLICLSWTLYWLSTLSFGFKFSNLSWRGLINTGLYKYMRHPAYFFKNLYWWLHTVPFFGVIGLDIVRNFLALSFISLIYYLRAKTEEKHLLKFKEYQDYYLWIEKHGLWAKIKKKLKKS
ncbi:isoprenylcysteine carboxylmethyltransferase family protein [Acinetobacter sp. YH01025]|uniref:methyltransferase family protein n=1 Tax=Acinetobacter sp. YH01025 TaxID=2601038 RepID=UPI0015D11BF1|nr:DUF1295 domain-containing protein [Acinetobacter sp. YH01025]